MAGLTSAINVQVNIEDKKLATNILNELGLNMSTAINIFIKQVIINEGLPFEVKNHRPNKDLRDSLKEAADIESGKIKVSSYTNREDLKKSLLSDD